MSTNYTIDQKRKGGRTTARMTRNHIARCYELALQGTANDEQLHTAIAHAKREIRLHESRLDGIQEMNFDLDTLTATEARAIVEHMEDQWDTFTGAAKTEYGRRFTRVAISLPAYVEAREFLARCKNK